MNKFATGLMAGGAIAAIGVGMAMSDKRTKRKIMNNGKKIAAKAEKMVENGMF